MSIIRYRFKADKNFESVKIDGMSCSLGELKRLIAAKSSRSGTHPKDDYDLIISNANTHEEYKDNSDLIPRNASVIVARRIRGTVDTLTPLSNQRPVVSSDDIVKDILLPAILSQNQTTTGTTTTTNSSVIETNAIPLEKLVESTNSTLTKEMTEDELIKEIQMDSQARYVTSQPTYRANLFVCHNCKQPGHIKSHCPLILSNSISTSNTANSSSSNSDGTLLTNINAAKSSVGPSSHIVTRHAPYPSNNYYRGHHSRRVANHPRGDPIPKKTTGIPRDRLIPVPKHIPGALRDQTGASVVPRQMAELYVERIEKKGDPLSQITTRSSEEKTIPSSITSSSKSTDNESPPNDLLCPICKHIFTDAVITPCCNLSFCDECIRTALISSSEHECPHCHFQHVAIDQINPNLYLRNHIKRWHERQNQSSYPHVPLSKYGTQNFNQDIDAISTNVSNSNEIDDDDGNSSSLNSLESTVPMKTAPIIIKMQPHNKTQSPPQPIVLTQPADITFEDEEKLHTMQAASNQKDIKKIEDTSESFLSSMNSEIEKSEHEISSSQVTPVNTIHSSPSLVTTMAATNHVVPHYYAAPPPPNLIYSHHIPPVASNGIYPMPPNYYPPPMTVRYPPAGIHHYPPYAPPPPVHHHHHPPPPAPPIVAPPHIPANGFNIGSFHPHSNAPYTSTSTFIAHHQTAAQSISTALSEDEFYIKQRYFQRIQRSPSRRRSRSSSYSSYSSSDSRSSSHSRYDHRHCRRRSSRSRSHHRLKSPVRDSRRQRRSSSYRSRRRPMDTKDKYSSKYRRSPLPPSRDRERRRSPRPPPTVQQSTQRTIVYMQESSHSRDRHRTKSRSHGIDDLTDPSSRKEQQTVSESIVSSSSSTKVPTTLSSKIEPVADTCDKIQEDGSKNGKKHKKHKKHHRSSSKSKKGHRSKDKEKKTTVDTTTSVIEIHS